jgi:prephenate dehydratase
MAQASHTQVSAPSFRTRKPGMVEDGLMSVMFTVGDKPGALTDVLKVFDKHKVNLTSIESRPSKGLCV